MSASVPVAFSPAQRELQNHLRVRAGLDPLPDPDEQLCCTRCGVWKPDEEFYRSARHGHRRHRRYECKVCSMTARLKYRAENIEKERATWRAWRAKRLKEDPVGTRAHYRELKRKNAGTVLTPENSIRCACGDLIHLNGVMMHRKACPPYLDSQADVV